MLMVTLQFSVSKIPSLLALAFVHESILAHFSFSSYLSRLITGSKNYIKFGSPYIYVKYKFYAELSCKWKKVLYFWGLVGSHKDRFPNDKTQLKYSSFSL